jgi:hypothetical protein
MRTDLDDLLNDFSPSQSRAISWRQLCSTYRGEAAEGSIEELRQLKQSILNYKARLEEPETPPKFESEFEHKTPLPKEKRRRMTENYRAIEHQKTEPRVSLVRFDNPDELIKLAKKAAGKIDDSRWISASLAGELLRTVLGDLSLRAIAKFVYEARSQPTAEVRQLQKSLADCEQQVKIMRDVVKESCFLMTDMSAKWSKDRQEANRLRQQLSSASTKASEIGEVGVLRTALIESERKFLEVASLLKKTQPRQIQSLYQQTQTDFSDLEADNSRLKKQLEDNLLALDAVSSVIEENALLKEQIEERDSEIARLIAQQAAVQSVLTDKLGSVKQSS